MRPIYSDYYDVYSKRKDSDFRRKKKFVQNGHSKKDHSRDPNDDWREFKQFKRDQKKCYNQQNLPRWYKKESNSMERQWERESIFREDWDNWIDKQKDDFINYWKFF